MLPFLRILHTTQSNVDPALFSRGHWSGERRPGSGWNGEGSIEIRIRSRRARRRQGQRWLCHCWHLPCSGPPRTSARKHRVADARCFKRSASLLGLWAPREAESRKLSSVDIRWRLGSTRTQAKHQLLRRAEDTSVAPNREAHGPATPPKKHNHRDTAIRKRSANTETQKNIMILPHPGLLQTGLHAVGF